MAKETTTKQTVSHKNTISFSAKFGLDKERKKLGVETDEKAIPPTYSPGKNFSITKIVITESKKKYDHADSVTGEMTRGKIGIAQMDGVTESGERFKVYSPNAAIVEACENILKDSDFGADKDGNLSTPALVAEVIEGKGEKNRPYIAFS